MTEIVAGLDLQTIGIIALCLVLGFVIVWTVLSARSSDRAGDTRSSNEESSGPREPMDGRET